MDTLTLIYREDPMTGLPRLEVPDANLNEADLRELKEQLHQRYQQLVAAGENQVISLNGSLGSGVPKNYSVSIQWHEGKRCPTVVLRSVQLEESARLAEEDTPLIPTSPGSRNWQVDFFENLAELLSECNTSGKRSALDFVLADMRAVWKKNPKTLTLLLLSGYLHCGDSISRHHGAPLENKYVEAARLLAEHFKVTLPEGTLNPLLE